MGKYMKLPDIENAFENIKKTCEKRLESLYPTGVPDYVKDRYETELKYLKTSEYLTEFEITRRLYHRAINDRYSYFISIPNVVNNSFIIYLITESKMNPLPAHYYCKKCGHFELADTKLFGIDLDSICCPSCSETIFADGFNLPIENVFGVNGKPMKELRFQYNVSKDFYPIAKEVLKEAFPDNAIVPSYTYGTRPQEYIIFPKGKGMWDYPQYITELPSGDVVVSRSIHKEKVWDFYMAQIKIDYKINAINEFQLRTGIYVKDIPLHDMLNVTWKDLHDSKYLINPDVKGVYRKYEPDTFYAMANFRTISLNHYVKKYPFTSESYWSDETNAYKVYDLKAFKKYPMYTVQDFFETLLQLGLDREKAYEISQLICNKKTSDADKDREGFEKLKEFYDEDNVDKAFKTVAKKHALVFERAYVAEALLEDLIMLYLSKQDNEIYNEIMNHL